MSEIEQGDERFRLIVENARDYAIILSDPNDVITAWMPGAAAVFGWSEEEMLGKPISSIFTPDDRANGIPEQELSRSEEHTSELQSLMRISSAVFCLKKKTKKP